MRLTLHIVYMIGLCLSFFCATSQITHAQDVAPKYTKEDTTKLNHNTKFSTEPNLFVLGIFPNDQGYLDARLYVRRHYADYFSSAIFFDYNTFKTEIDEGLTNKQDRETREYRVDIDLLKGIIPLYKSHKKQSALSIEPGLNLKGIFQNTQETRIFEDRFKTQVFRQEDSDYTRSVVSAKLEISFAKGKDFLLDFANEYLPIIYSEETSTVNSSQFNNQSAPQVLTSYTSGFQSTLRMKLKTKSFGYWSLQGKFFMDRGERSAYFEIIDGSYKYSSINNAVVTQQDLWVELIHSMKYLKRSLSFIPAISLGLQQRVISTNNEELENVLFKIGFLVEFEK